MKKVSVWSLAKIFDFKWRLIFLKSNFVSVIFLGPTYIVHIRSATYIQSPTFFSSPMFIREFRVVILHLCSLQCVIRNIFIRFQFYTPG